MPASAQFENIDSTLSPSESGILVSRSIDISSIDVRSIFHKLNSPRILWSSPNQAFTLSFGSAITLSATGDLRFEKIKEAADLSFADADIDSFNNHLHTPKFFGGFSFDPSHKESPPWSGFHSSLFILPKINIVQSDNGFELTLNMYGEDIDPFQVESDLISLKSDLESMPLIHSSTNSHQFVKLTPSISNSLWNSQVNEILGSIKDGSVHKVVLAQSLRATLECPPSLLDVFYNLCDQNPGCYHFLFEPLEGNTMFGATPELLVSRNGNLIQTEVLAGSIARGSSQPIDEDLSKKLLMSSKNQHEHSIVLDNLNSKIKSFSNDVEINPQKIKKLETVQHIWTTMKAHMHTNDHILSITNTFHPTPAISGIPSDVAQNFIRSTEPFERGWYGGPFGWFDPTGNGEFVVCIRSAIAHENEVVLYAGAGIVQNSDPQEEWEEIQLKFQPILNSFNSP
mgnify:CR=1 FL=1|tara:strand:+ start:15498 stop:16862 length:1365 start_codon:yes stop_codon:yes gene_type:complete